MIEVNKSKIIQSLFWKLMERGGTQTVQLIVMIVLTRLLLPEDYGLIAIVAIFISIATLIVDSGFSEALIQRKEVDNIDLTSVFYLNLFIATIVYITLYFTAPFIANFFGVPNLILILRISSLSLFLSAFYSIQQAIIVRNMQFKLLFKSTLFAVFISGIVGLYMAYKNFGVWAIVGQQLTSQLIVTVILCFVIKWKPGFIFSFESVLKLFSYGWKLVVSTLIYTFYTNMQSLVISRIVSPAMLGFYSRGMQFPAIFVSNINGTIQSVMFPTLASQQDNRKQVRRLARRSIVTSSFIIFPMMVGLAVIAEPLVIILFTEKWLSAVPFLQIFCGYYALWSIDATNLHVIKALGHSDIFLKLEILKFLIGILILIISIPYGVYGIALGVLINRIITTIIDAYPNKYLINYSFIAQLKDTKDTIFLSLAMGTITYSIKGFEFSDIITIIIQIIVGTVVYVGLALLFKIESFTYLVFSMKEVIQRKKDVVLD
ncbi:lipopolysaccharide biosynthesis protein [Solibacillus sp. FSL K6-1126]|uniref:lipopolysaccharide biosynthesis protein n=1 Tax=Solibacillus sp. FSL K6-1126 TaxID=2921463 RepID=UPI0030FA8B75